MPGGGVYEQRVVVRAFGREPTIARAAVGVGQAAQTVWGELHLLGRRLAPHTDPPPLHRGWLHIRQ